jgi:hypothetical protein
LDKQGKEREMVIRCAKRLGDKLVPIVTPTNLTLSDEFKATFIGLTIEGMIKKMLLCIF